MSSATAAATRASKGKGKGMKKLVIIGAVLLLLLGGGGGAAIFVMKSNMAAANGDAAAPERSAHDSSQPPTYVALDPFVFNLADREVERYAQVAVTLQVDDPKFAEKMKAYMPSIRNNILLVLSDKSSQQLLARSGKDALATEIMREAVRPMGIEINPEDEAEAPAEETGKKRRKRRPQVHNPITHVHFANFIIQ